MYSPYMARLIAMVVVHAKGLLLRGGEWVPFSNKVGGEENDPAPVARFAPGNELGMQPLQPPKGIPAYHKDGPLQAPIDEQLRGATEQYLDFFGEIEYSPAALGVWPNWAPRF